MPTDGPSAVLPVFEAYQRARVDLVQALAEMAVPPMQRPGAHGKVPSAQEEMDYRTCIEALENYRGQLVRTVAPLSHDLVTGVQFSALVALTRLSRASDKLADAVGKGELLPHICQLLAGSMVKKEIKLGAAHLLSQVVRDPVLATQALEAGAINTLIESFEEYEPEMKTAALWVIGSLATSDKELATAATDAGAVRPALLSLGEPYLPLQRIAASLLADIAKHAEELGLAVHEAGGAVALAPLLSSRDPVVRTQALRCIAQLCKFGRQAGERVPPTMHPTLVQLVSDPSDDVVQAAATVIRELAKYDERTAGRLIEAGCLKGLLEALTGGRGSPAAPAESLGVLGSYSEEMAEQVLDCGAVPVLAQGLRLSGAGHVRAIVAGSLAALGKQSPDAADAIAEAGVMPVLQALATVPDQAQKAAADKALAAIAHNLREYDHLLEMVEAAAHAPSTLPVALHALAGLFAESEEAGRHQAHFVATGHMRGLQAMKAEADPRLKKAIDALNATFPEEVVEQLQPDYEKGLLDQIGGDDDSEGEA